MHDRNEDEIVTIDDSIQRLKTVAFLLKGLYGQLAEEQETITLASGQMAHAVKQFQNHLTQFEAFEKSCRQYIVDTVKKELRQSATTVADEISHYVAEQVTTPVYQSLTQLQQLSQHVEQQFNQQTNTVRSTKLWFAAGLLCTSILCGLAGALVVHYYLPENNAISRYQMQLGGILMDAFPKLSKEEKTKLFKLAAR